MRVVHVTPYFPPDRIGGVGEVVRYIHEELLSLGHDSRVITSGRSRGTPYVHRVARTPSGFALRCALSKPLIENTDVIHLHHGEGLGLLARSRIDRARPSALVTFHVSNKRIAESLGSFEWNGQNIGGDWSALIGRLITAPAKHLLDQMAMRLSDQVSFISKSGAREVLGVEGAAEARVVYNGLPELPNGPQIRSVEHTDLLYVGRASQRKRTALLPFILQTVREKKTDARLRIVGFDQSQAPSLVSNLTSFGLEEAVIFEGAMPAENVRPFYDAATVLVLPSAYEGLPMVILEAQQASLPAVVTAVGGNSEVIEDRVNGLVVAPDNPVQMGRACLEILEDTELAASMGSAGRTIVTERFSVDQQVRQYLELYQRLTR